MKDEEYRELKHLASRLYDLCSTYWPEEFKKIFKATRWEFMDWLNLKTGVEENHIKDKRRALTNWVNALERMKV